MKVLYCASIIAALTLASCSGGGGASSPVPAPAPPAAPSVTHGSLVTLDANGNVNVYAPGATSSTQTFNVGSTAKALCIGRDDHIDVLQPSPTSYTLVAYAAASNGPSLQISSLTSTLAESGLDCAMDSAGNRFVVGSLGASSNIDAFGPSAAGTVPPQGQVDAGSKFTNVTVDGNNSIYAVCRTCGYMLIYNQWGGTSAPARSEVLAFTQSIDIDASGQMYLSDGTAPSVTVLAPGSGDASHPLRVLSGPLTQLNPPGVSSSRLVARADNSGKIYVANLSTNVVQIFAPSATGNVAPMQTITLAANTVDIRVAP